MSTIVAVHFIGILTIQTDKNGKISIECQNGMYANPVIIHAEMLKGGIPCSITIIGEKKKK